MSTSSKVMSDSWQFSPRRILSPGWRLRVRGSSAWFTFLRHVATDDAEWVECVDVDRRNRCFAVDLVREVKRPVREVA